MNETPELATGPLDIQHDTDPAHEEPPARRIPHLGHTILYFSLNAFCILLGVLSFLAFAHDTTAEAPQQHPFLTFLGQYAGELMTLAIAVPLFPIFWRYPFWQGIQWNVRRAKLNWWKLMLAGLVLTLAANTALSLSHAPSDSDLIELFKTTSMAWVTTLIAALIAPLAEEIAFRGFLLPSLATAYDWLALERTPAGLDRWQQSSENSTPAWCFATFFSSLGFALLHGPQNHYHAGVLTVLFAVSVCFSVVRIRLRSVAASTLLHVAYNAFPLLGSIYATGGFRHLDKLK